MAVDTQSDGQIKKTVVSAQKKTDFTIATILAPHFSDVEKIDRQYSSGYSDINILSSEEELDFKWLQCTRYKPPKLPRTKKRDKIVKRNLGRNPRIPFSPTQLSLLERKFTSNQYLSTTEAGHLAQMLNISETRVKIWFQNRRAKERRDRQEGREPSTSETQINSHSQISFGISSTTNPGPIPPATSVIQHFSSLRKSGSSAFRPIVSTTSQI